MHYRAAVLLVLLLLASIQLPAVAGDYTLAPDDVIEVNVWREPDLSRKQIQVDSSGNITVPYVNQVVKAAGLTQRELALKLAEEYVKAEILTDPKIEVNLLIRHRLNVWVLGQAQRPGVVTFKEGDTITSAIAEAGSFSQEARLEAATLTRRGLDKPIPIDLKKLYHDGDLSQNYPLQEGDVIYIPEDTFNRYYVIGEVQRQGMYVLKDNATVLSAVMQAGGATERGSLKNVMLIRGDINNPEKRTVDLNKMVKGDLSQDIKLEPGDVVYIAETSKPNWNKISQVLNALVSVGALTRYGLF